MPRKSRIDAQDALHHVIVRGIEGRKIFHSDYDRQNFIDRIGKLILETQTDCFAWALIERNAWNHIVPIKPIAETAYKVSSHQLRLSIRCNSPSYKISIFLQSLFFSFQICKNCLSVLPRPFSFFHNSKMTALKISSQFFQAYYHTSPYRWFLNDLRL